eukprot:COSAG02_NODE_42831_length_380_cov_6.032028_2_plen_20_part_01
MPGRLNGEESCERRQQSNQL